MASPSLRTTLLPYTTLFRSEGEVEREHGRTGGGPQPAGDIVLALALEQLVVALEGAVEPRRRGDLDRKSTRLNSSHGYISYAVFCLKKKKKDVVMPGLIVLY